MTKNPILNALIAFLYISLVVLLLFFGRHQKGPDNSILLPLAFISLFTLSACSMGYIFLYQPFQLYFDGKKKQALDLLLKTVLTFGIVTLCLVILAFSGIFPAM